nr:MAG TPA: NinB protein [Caudoviricetes sp.]
MAIDFSTDKAILSLVLEDKEEAAKCFDELRNEEILSIKISKYRKKRSLNANNYAWHLISEIAENQGIPKEDVYRQYIKDIGVYRQIEIDEKAVDTLIHSWQLHGIGWVADKLDYSKHEGFVLLNLYYGSSTYNTLQMSRLIDNIVQDCKALGIETRTPNEINSMLALWEEQK